MAFICVVPATHFDISSAPSLDINHEQIMKTPDGTQKLYNMVAKFYGKTVPILAVKPEYLLFTDDTVQYIYEGKGDIKDSSD